MDSILSDEPSVHTLPDGPESDSSPAPAAEPKPELSEGETPEPAAAKVSTKPVTAKVADDDEGDEVDDPVDQSLEGLKKALTAVRGDKRTMRKKWREAEKRAEDTARRIAQLEGQITAYSQMGTRQPEPAAKTEAAKAPDFYGSPEEHLSFRENRLISRLQADQSALRDQVQSEQFRRDATRSERRMRRDFQDYDEAKAAFYAVVKDGKAPALVQKMMEDPDPADVVYEEGKRLLRGGKSERETELEAKLAEYEAKAASSAVQAAETPKPHARPIPKSIASARGSGNGVPKAWNGPRSAKEIYGE